VLDIERIQMRLWYKLGFAPVFGANGQWCRDKGAWGNCLPLNFGLSEKNFV